MNRGNGAREVLLAQYPPAEVDHFLAWLWCQGYKIVPVDGESNMKQGTGNSRMGSTKVEPSSKAINPGTVADIGIQEVRYRPHKDLGRGYKAPMAAASTHPRGSQGKH